MKAAIGLGNPGGKYRGTRHNVGFEVIEAVFRKNPGKRRDFELKKFTSAGTELAFVSESPGGLLVMPQMYMNNSGGTVDSVRRHYGLGPEDLLIVCDDVNLPGGQIRFRKSGSSGGQKGLESVIAGAGGRDIPRLRIGIGRSAPAEDLSEFVLSPFDRSEQALIRETVERAAEAVLVWFADGIDAAMNRCNAKTSE